MQIGFVQVAHMVRSVTEAVNGIHAKSIYQLPESKRVLNLPNTMTMFYIANP
jgi:hypothetical protein